MAQNPNLELLLGTLGAIEDNQGRWLQESWRAKFDTRDETAFCFAGWVVEVSEEADWDADYMSDDGYTEDGERYYNLSPVVRVGNLYYDDPELYALHALRITRSEAQRLFASYNTLDEIREIVSEITARAIDTESITELEKAAA